MLRHLYGASPTKFEELIAEICGENPAVGPTFRQQVTRRNRNCFDGSIIQSPFDITIETKRDPNLDYEQIKNYIIEISDSRGTTYSDHGGIAILIGLASREDESAEFENLRIFARERHLFLVSTSFQRLLDELQQICREDSSNLRGICQDFEEYLVEEGVLVKDIMKAFPCKDTLEFNREHCMYTVGADTTRYTNARIIGFYHDKCITHIGEVNTIVEGIYDSETKSFEPSEFLTPNRDTLEHDELNRIRSMNNDMNYLSGRSFRYFLLGDIVSTRFKKESPYALQRVKNFILSDWVDNYKNGETTVQEVAVALNSKSW